MMDDLPGIARPAAAVFSSLSAMAAGVIIHRALRPTPARMELHPLRQYWLEPRAINIAPLATSTVLFYRTIIIGRSDGMPQLGCLIFAANFMKFYFRRRFDKTLWFILLGIFGPVSVRIQCA